MPHTQDLHVSNTKALLSPRELRAQAPASEQALENVAAARSAVIDVLAGRDRRLMAVVGPCSIHDPGAALEYAEKLAGLAERVADRMLVLMRVYFEKPRTTVGWKGLINDPHLNDTFDIETGLERARDLLRRIAALGLPTATELLEPITPQYIADLIVLASIGARTTESQTHRQMASGLSMPVGFKNGTDGNLQVALDAMKAAGSPHAFLGIDADGRTAIVHTRGNPHGVLVLRGGRSGANFHPPDIQDALDRLAAAGLPPRLVVDCSHANSEKDHRKQAAVFDSVVDQRAGGADGLVGLMLESNLHEGNQPFTADPADLKHGVSVTDACIGWDRTEALLLEAHEKMSAAVGPAASRTG